MNARTNPLITLVLIKCVYDHLRKGFATLSFDAHGITTSLFHACDARGIVGILLRCPSDAAPAQSIDIERQPSKFRKLANTPASIPSRFALTQPASMIAFAILLHYEYSPFGETVVSTGPNASDFLHRFSTKPAEDNTGLVLYEYRVYSPSTGRFISKDPIGEDGGLNLYNASVVNGVDMLGLTGINPWVYKQIEGRSLANRCAYPYTYGECETTPSSIDSYKFECEENMGVSTLTLAVNKFWYATNLGEFSPKLKEGELQHYRSAKKLYDQLFSLATSFAKTYETYCHCMRARQNYIRWANDRIYEYQKYNYDLDRKPDGPHAKLAQQAYESFCR